MSHTNLTNNGDQDHFHHQPSYTIYEKELLRLIYDGLTTKQLAAKQGVSIKAIEKSRNILFRKAQVHNIAQLLRHALRTKLIIDPYIS